MILWLLGDWSYEFKLCRNSKLHRRIKSNKFRSLLWNLFNNCPTRCNTMQSIYYSANSIYMFWVSTTPIIRITQNCNYSLRYWSYVCATTSLYCGHDRGRCGIVLCCVVLFYFMSCYVMLCYVMLRYVMLCYVMLC